MLRVVLMFDHGCRKSISRLIKFPFIINKMDKQSFLPASKGS